MKNENQHTEFNTAFDFKITADKSYKNIEYIIYGVIAFFWLFILAFDSLVPDTIPTSIAAGIPISIIVCAVVRYVMYRIEIKQQFVVLSFKKNHLIIDNNSQSEIDYSQIQKIILEYESTKGLQESAIIQVYFPVRTSGKNNQIKIITKDKKKIAKYVWCENDKDFWRFSALGDFLKECGIDVRMVGFAPKKHTASN